MKPTPAPRIAAAPFQPRAQADAFALLTGRTPGAEGDAWPPRLSPVEAQRFAGLTARQLKGLRERRAVRFFRLGRRTLVYDRDSLAALLTAGMVDALPTS